jgi:hypothetical protein
MTTAKAAKTYTIRTTRNDRSMTFTGTVQELTEKFGYTLECGNSWNHRINRNPTTIKSLVSNLEKSYDAKERACYTRTQVELI